MTPLELVLARLQGVRKRTNGFAALCPAHEDQNPSLSVALGGDGRVLLKCHAGCSVEAICGAVGIGEAALFATPAQNRSRRTQGTRAAGMFTAGMAARAWREARARARDDEAVAADADTYDYIRSRGLSESWECPGFGIVSEDMDLPPPVRSWPDSGHRLVLGLHDQAGKVAGLQARRIEPGEPKVLFPSGSAVKGTVFANGPGVALLRGRLRSPCTVIFGEGLTDYLALACAAAGYAVLSAPGTGFAVPAVGRWAIGARVVVAVDSDEAGRRCADELVPALYRHGARDVYRAIWPGACKDACDVVADSGIAGLEEFIGQQMLEVRSA